MSVLMTVKIAVFAPMPSASVSTATAVNPGFFSNWRKANLRSFIFGFPYSSFFIVGGPRFDAFLDNPSVEQVHLTVGVAGEARIMGDHADCRAFAMQLAQ